MLDWSRRRYLSTVGAAVAAGGCLSSTSGSDPVVEPVEFEDLKSESTVAVLDPDLEEWVETAVVQLTAGTRIEDSVSFPLDEPLQARYEGNVYAPSTIRRSYTAYSARIQGPTTDVDEDATVVSVAELPAKQRWRANRAIEEGTLRWLSEQPDFYEEDGYLERDGEYHRFEFDMHGDTAPMTFFVMKPVYPDNVTVDAPLVDLSIGGFNDETRNRLLAAVEGDESPESTDGLRAAAARYDYLVTQQSFYRSLSPDF